MWIITKKNELTELTTEIKQAIQKIEEENNNNNNNNNKNRINDYAKLTQSIKKEYQKLALENEILKKGKKLEDKQLTTDLINHHRKQKEFFDWNDDVDTASESNEESDDFDSDDENDNDITYEKKTNSKTNKK